MTELEQYCLEFLELHLDPDNVWSVLTNTAESRTFDLHHKCLDYVSQNAKDCLLSDNVVNVCSKVRSR